MVIGDGKNGEVGGTIGLAGVVVCGTDGAGEGNRVCDGTDAPCTVVVARVGRTVVVVLATTKTGEGVHAVFYNTRARYVRESPDSPRTCSIDKALRVVSCKSQTCAWRIDSTRRSMLKA